MSRIETIAVLAAVLGLLVGFLIGLVVAQEHITPKLLECRDERDSALNSYYECLDHGDSWHEESFSR
jgi:hypothetical protein